MNELIAIGNRKVGEGSIPTVNARDLHEFLGSKKDFSSWMKQQIKRARLVENRDYITYTQKGEGGKFDTIEYHLTLEAGKHISMMSGCDKGFEVRDYFLECERIAKAAPATIAIPTHAEALRLAADALDQNETLKQTISEQAPKVAALDRISTADGLMCITDAAKVLGMKPKALFAYLSANQWIYRRVGGKNWLGYQAKIQAGVVDHKVRTLTLADGTETLRESVYLTAKGIAFLAKVFAVPSRTVKAVPVQMTIN